MFSRNTWTVSPGKARRVSAWQRSAMLRLTGLRSGLHEVDRVAGTGLEAPVDDLLDTLRSAVDREAARRKSAMAAVKNSRRAIAKAAETDSKDEAGDAESKANQTTDKASDEASREMDAADPGKEPVAERSFPALDHSLRTETESERRLVFARLRGLRTGLLQSARETQAGCEAQIDRLIVGLHAAIDAMPRPAERRARAEPDRRLASHLRIVESKQRVERRQAHSSVRRRDHTAPQQTFVHHPPADQERLALRNHSTPTKREDESAISEVLTQKYDALVGELTGRYGEVLVGSGVDRRGLIMKLFVAPGGTSWSLVAADGHGKAGVIGAGSDWQAEGEILPLPGELSADGFDR